MAQYNLTMSAGRGWYSRGYLPHFDAEGQTQFVTWRQEDSVPRDVIARWQHELKSQPDTTRKRELQRRIELFCDAGHGSCVLRSAEAAQVVMNILELHEGELYALSHWVIMPNHVHALLTPLPQISLAKVMHQLKGQSSREINKLISRCGRVMGS